MHPLLAKARLKQEEMVALIRELVECESPSDNPAALARCGDLLAETLSPLGKVRRSKGGHLRCEFTLPGPRRKTPGQILALGHLDTVWPLGTLAGMPFRQEQGRLWGPGVLDMKAGLAFLIHAVLLLVELDQPVLRKLVLQVNADEEVGSDSSRQLTEQAAQQSVAVLVLEPGTGLEGKLKTARKGVGDYTVTVRGRAAHSGVDFSSGASAILELGRQIAQIALFTDMERGITVNPGVVSGGTRINVIAAEARAEVDIRVARLRDAERLEKKFRALKPFDKRCSITVEGGLNRPPMERSAGIRRLFQTARTLAAGMGITLEESMTGGGSDGNFTAALGVPTLDGLGAVGEGAHALNESILVDRIADRTALLAGLIQRI
jgi:glutamate carboxypeptidase